MLTTERAAQMFQCGLIGARKTNDVLPVAHPVRRLQREGYTELGCRVSGHCDLETGENIRAGNGVKTCGNLLHGGILDGLLIGAQYRNLTYLGRVRAGCLDTRLTAQVRLIVA